MKNALILHGTDANHHSNWFPWLKKALIDLNYNVWLPDLPQANQPNIVRYNQFILHDPTINWQFNSESIIIGHSSGAVEILGLLNDPQFPPVTIKAGFLIGAFKGNLGRNSLNGMVANFNYNLIRTKARQLIFIHSNDDPNCSIEDARNLSQQLKAQLIEFQGMGHFSQNTMPEYKKFPELLTIIQANL